MTENEFLARLHEIRDGFGTDEEREQFDKTFLSEMKNPVIHYGFNYFLGFLAVGRFSLGHIGVAIPKLIVGILGLIGAAVVEDPYASESMPGAFFVLCYFAISIWIIVDYFLMPAATRRHNVARAENIAAGIAGQPAG